MKNYNTPELEITKFEETDVIATSSDGLREEPGEGTFDDVFEWT